MSRLASPLRRLLPFAAVAVLASLLGSTVALAGGNLFTDVGPTHPFVDEIEGIAQAGITTGYGDGTFRPGDPVTRGAMAAFMGRGFGRINTAGGVASNNPADGANVQLGVAVMNAGAASGSGGYVHLTADAQMSAPVAECQCAMTVEIVDQETGSVVASRSTLSDDVNVVGVNIQSVALGGVVEIDPNENNAYTLRARATIAGSNSGTSITGRIVATYVPFPYNAYEPTV